MNIIEFSEDLQVKLKEKMEAVAATNRDELSLTAQILSIIEDCIRDLNKRITKYVFMDLSEEIKFFKEVRPVFVSQYLYHSKLFSIQLYNSYNDVDARQGFYEEMLKNLELFAKKNRDFYAYILSSCTKYDERYFTRQQKSPLNENPFSTQMDRKLSKLLANELLKNYLQDALRNKESQSTESILTWTAPKTALIELGIALQSAGTFNNSKADIREVFAGFERVFNVNLKDHYRMFLHIKDRKKGQTTFLDQLKERLIQRINEGDAL